MRRSHHLTALAAVFTLAVSVGSHPYPCRANERRTDAGTARLKIDGEFILSLVLLDEHSEPITFVSSMKDHEVAFILLYGLYDFGLSGLDIEVLVISLVFGFCLCCVALPFLILAFCTPYYKRALENVIPLQSTPTQSNGAESEPTT